MAEAYFVGPERPGPGVLLLPSWFGSTSGFRRRADALADDGFTVLAVDLTLGERPTTVDEAQSWLAEVDPNELAAATQSSAALLAERAAQDRIGVVGLGMGGSMALWLSARRPDLVGATVAVYASQSIDFAGATSRYQLHTAADDPWVSDDDFAFLEATLRMEHLDVEVVGHDAPSGFANEAGPAHDSTSADRLWSSVVPFLRDAAATQAQTEADSAAATIRDIRERVAAHLDAAASDDGEAPDPGDGSVAGG